MSIDVTVGCLNTISGRLPGCGAGELAGQDVEGLGGGGAAVGESQPDRVRAGRPELNIHCE